LARDRIVGGAKVKDRTKVIIAVLLALVVIVSVYVLVVTSPSNPPGESGSATCSPRPMATYDSTPATNTTTGNWTTYHGDNTRDGILPMGPVNSVVAKWTGAATLDGPVYAEPLVCGDSVYVATENNTVYAIDDSTGAAEWKTHLGTPVESSTLPCGDIGPTTGITGTPVIDVAAQTLFVVAFLSGLSANTHVLFGLNVDTGSVTFQVGADGNGAIADVEQQRGALALANGYVYVPYGGLAGDCGAYHGWVVGVPTSGSGTVLSYQVPTEREGGIWAAGGITVSPEGDLYVATGNGASTSTYDYGDSVIELTPTLQVVSSFAPTNWIQLNQDDTDLGSVAPTILSNGDVFQIGKAGVGYLLSGTNLGGIGGQLYNGSICSAAFGGTAREGQSIFVPCTNGLFDVLVNGSEFSVAWQTTDFDSGSPIVTGDIVWAVDVPNANLLGFNISTGQQVFSFPLGSADHFISPGAAPGSLFVAGGNQLFAFDLA
jgi:hypothetical protein